MMAAVWEWMPFLVLFVLFILGLLLVNYFPLFGAVPSR